MTSESIRTAGSGPRANGAARTAGPGSPGGVTRDRMRDAAPGEVRIGGRRLEVAPHNCFACGTLNAHGLQLRLHAAEDRCWTQVTLPDRFEGWHGIAHGGIVCTILDEVMAWALVDRDTWGLTARLSVEFRRPVPIGRPLRAEGRVAEVRRRLVSMTGRLVDPVDGSELATAVGTYVAASEARKAELKARYRVRFVPDGESSASPAPAAAATATRDGERPDSEDR